MNLVVDWDGTVTERDTLDLVLAEFGDPEVYERVEAELGRTLTLHEVQDLEFATVRAPLDEVVAFVRERAHVRPGFHELAERFRPLIVSSGFHELIEPVLERERLTLDVRANRLDPRPDGWRIRYRDESECGTCAEPCKRRSLPSGRVVYVGDSYSDRCAALAADDVFARDGLARYLTERGHPFRPFDDFYDVIHGIAA